MPDTLSLRGLPAISRKNALAGFVLVGAGLLLLALLATNIARQIDPLGSSSIDNVQWTISQMDVELLTLQVAVHDAYDGRADLDEVRRRFDIAYSRFQTLKAGGLFGDLRRTRGFDGAFAALSDFMTRTVAAIDGPDPSLHAVLPGIESDLRRLIPSAHRMGTVGVEVFARQADQTRAEIKSTLITLAILSVGLFAVLLAMVGRLVVVSGRTRARAQEASATASRLDAVIRASLDPVLTLDEAGRITGFSPAGRQVFGHEPAAILGQGLDILIPPGASGPQVALGPQTEPQRLRVTARRADGSDFPAEASVSAVTAGGRPMFVVFLSDLSAQAAAEMGLVTARDTALAGEKAKADLLVLMSHEIRTPLNGMIGTIDLMQATELGPQQRAYLRIMADSGRLLMNQVNDILDMARLDSGKVGLSLAPLDLGALVDDVTANQRPASAVQGNQLEVQIAPDCPTRVLGDAGRLRQVMLNLVGNAVKFTQGGRIVVRLRHLADLGLFEITVTDTGIGIAPQNLDRIFEDFVTLDPSFARTAAGTGLGLGIVRRIVTRMGGEISVESAPQKGSTFRLTLPLTVTTEAPEPCPLPAALPLPQGKRILVVEDNDFNRLIVRDMLIQDGHAVTEARDGAEGVARAEAQAFDLILMDISMPGLDGIEATQRLRQGTGPNAATPILALTAHAMPDDLIRFRKAGMGEVLLKPLERAVLRQALAAHLPMLCDDTTRAEMARTLPLETLTRLTGRFLTDMQDRLDRLESAAPDEAEKEAHHMAGSAGVFGARAMGAALETALTHLRQGDIAAFRAALPGLRQLWARTAATYQPDSSSRDQASSLR